VRTVLTTRGALDASLAAAGLALAGHAAWHEMSRETQRDDDTEPPLFYAVDQYRVDVTPA